MARIGILPLGRPTFDVVFAEENLARMLSALDTSGHEITGPRELLFDASAARDAVEALKDEKPEQILILQVTFTDASMTIEIANSFDVPLSIWAIPEPRIGGRLRLNSFCGLNLAGHTLGLNRREFSYLYAAPDAEGIGAAIEELLAGRRTSKPVPLQHVERKGGAGADAVATLRGARIGRIGAPPDGFGTCLYDAEKLKALADVSVEEMQLDTLFSGAKAVSGVAAAGVRADADAIARNLADVDQDELDRSLRLKAAIEEIQAGGGFDAFAIRCWPETFTEYGGAVCGPVSMMGEARVPCACEADVYGALTTLLLQRIADAPAFLADLVDLDEADDTGVVWHCGQAPVSMADPDARIDATIHTNRKMPLLFEFPLKAGRVTFFRISQARGETFAVIGGGEVMKRPMAFTGTSGVVRFDSGSKAVLERVMGAALEHHMALVYGDHRDALAEAAGALGIPVLAL
ncbi:hypothetical protein HPQ64_16420 [Rhizobiales bacterium]|uniref:L-fucose/L-arabinose isomerase family protein n=1 Tax=Hongsoonwoonella zoysiae TaxID=2821844 RepID=UPI0015619B4D|nr:hypothetical protein [Hongsoonwoonella zoysiae]NRG19277.1 hypothetical protein [Hongsoonwoonella zoysiae]